MSVLIIIILLAVSDYYITLFKDIINVHRKYSLSRHSFINHNHRNQIYTYIYIYIYIYIYYILMYN